MAINLLERQVPAIGFIPLKNADGSPMLDEKNEPCGARVHSPASRVYEVAQATLRRKAMKRVRENGGKIEANADDAGDRLEFLIDITEEFLGVEVPLEKGQTGAKAMVRAILSNPQLGYIRDQIEAASSDWGSFTDGSANG